MISLLTGLLVPLADNALRVFLETIAFALGWNGIDRLLTSVSLETSSFISPEISAATVFRKSSLDSVAFAAPLRPRPRSSLRSLILAYFIWTLGHTRQVAPFGRQVLLRPAG